MARLVPLILMLLGCVAASSARNPDECVLEECSDEVSKCHEDGDCSDLLDGFQLCVRGWGCGVDCKNCATKGTNLDPVVGCAIEKKCVPDLWSSNVFSSSSNTNESVEMMGEWESTLLHYAKSTLCYTTGYSCDSSYDVPMVWAAYNGGCQMLPKAFTCRYPKANFNYFDLPWEDGTCQEQGYNVQRGSARGCDKITLPPDMSHTWWSQK